MTRWTSFALICTALGCDGGSPERHAVADAGVDTGGDDTGSSACPPSGVTAADATRSSDAASVTVTATLLDALEHCGKDELSFALVLDTHSVDLTGIDVAAIAVIATDLEPTPAGGAVWGPGSVSSHHVDGTLRAPAPALAGATRLTLTIPGVAGVDRVFEWEEPLLAHAR